mmetsp:Transcript_6057/g.23516  ORF Transcript_6057/g.23516 Transcript_6057/m.23516 type:complete len:462 (+) Transcript_6057:1617-3002(+)|eukprot:scaffold602_cov298-Pinguiococcus_pyrenoidosus.AAC.11
MVADVRDQQRLAKAHRLHQGLGEVRCAEAHLRFHLVPHPLARHAVCVEDQRISASLSEDDGILEGAALLRQRIRLPLHADVRILLRQDPLDDVQLAPVGDAQRVHRRRPLLVQRLPNGHVEAASVGQEGAAQQSVATEGPHAHVELGLRLVPAFPLGRQRVQELRGARDPRTHLLHLRLELRAGGYHFSVLRLQLRNRLLKPGDLRHHRVALLFQLLGRLLQGLHLLPQGLDASQDLCVLDLALRPGEERSARLRRALGTLLIQAIGLVQDRVNLSDLAGRDAFRIVVDDAADEVVASEHLADVRPVVRLLLEHHHDDLQDRLDDRGGPREGSHLVELRLLDVLHAVLCRTQRRLHVLQLLLDRLLLERQLLTTLLKLRAEAIGLCLALLGFVLLTHHLLELFVRRGVLSLELRCLLAHAGLQLRHALRRVFELVQALANVHRLLLQIAPSVLGDSAKAAE